MAEYSSTGRTSPSLKPVLIAVLAAFLLGAVTVGFLAWRGLLPSNRTAAAAAPAVAAPADTTVATVAAPLPVASETAAADVARVAETQGGLDQRLAAAEQRLARLDLQAQAASGNAARAEGLLIAFAARRALERGAQLGYLSDQLRLRFGDAQPNSVQTVIDFAARPVTLDALQARLDGLQPRLQEAAAQPGLARLQRELSTLFVIRRESSPSPQPARRFDRARRLLEMGRVDQAIAEVELLPGSAAAQGWLADARRYDRAQRALDLLETAAVQEPRRLRDGEGASIEQLSPAAAASGAN